MIDFDKLSLVRVPPNPKALYDPGFVRARIDVVHDMTIAREEWREDIIALAERRARFGVWKQFYGPIRDPLARVEIALRRYVPDPHEADQLIADIPSSIPKPPT